MAPDKNKPKLADSINDNLKRVFQETLSEEIPDRFKDLLAKLKEQDDKTPGGGSDES